MPYVCCVVNCFKRRNKDTPRTFHRFPTKKDPQLCERWINAVSRKNADGSQWRPTEYSRICSDHFLPTDYLAGLKVRTLRDNAVPSVFSSYPVHKQCQGIKRRPSPKKRPPGEHEIKKAKISHAQIVSQDHNYSGPPLEQAMLTTKSELVVVKKQLADQKKEIRLLHRKIKRRDVKLSSLMEELKEQHLINDEQVKLLNLNFDKDTLTLIENELKALGTKSRKFSDDLKKFAVTMHFYSAQAYNYLRKFLTLPHPDTIRTWASSINCLPGFLTEVIASLKDSLTSNRKDVAIVFDAMSLKSAYQLDKKSNTYVGSVNYGHMQTGCDETLATEALVFMVVGLKEQFKIPIAYFLIDKLTSQTQAQMVRDAVILVSEAGHTVRAVICDGNFTNQSTAALLGCKLQNGNINPAFSVDGIEQQLYFIFDVCHLLKNVRNCFKEYGPLFSNSQEINWKFMEELHMLQQNDNLVLANKLRSKHVNFENHKMNVRVAAQTLSNSVANAIDFAHKDLHLPQFEGSSATTHFVRVFDEVFDICNSNNPHAKYSKSAITAQNKEEKFKILSEAITYIESLTDKNGKKLVVGRRKTGFVGFICSIKSIIALSTDLLNVNFKFVLTYRMSQDHLEMFFSRIRRRHGWNNNPTPLQFKWSLRMLLMKNGILSSQHANCIDVELSSKVFEQCENIPTIQQAQNKPSILDDFVSILLTPSEYHDNALFYISGYICHTVATKINCTHCCELLHTQSQDHTPQDADKLTRRRDKGGLIYSNDMFKVVSAADKSLRKILTGSEGPVKSVDPYLSTKVFRDVMQSVGITVFPQIQDHSVNCHAIETEESHTHQIIKAAVNLFCRTMLHHHERIINERYIQKNKTSSRHKLTKTILFLHQ